MDLLAVPIESILSFGDGYEVRDLLRFRQISRTWTYALDAGMVEMFKVKVFWTICVVCYFEPFVWRR